MSMSSPPRRRPSAEVDGAQMLGASSGQCLHLIAYNHDMSTAVFIARCMRIVLDLMPASARSSAA